VLLHRAFRFQLERTTRSGLDSRRIAEASRFTFNWGLSLRKDRLQQRPLIRESAFPLLFSDDSKAHDDTVAVP
jgi:hypothetical protein